MTAQSDTEVLGAAVAALAAQMQKMADLLEQTVDAVQTMGERLTAVEGRLPR